MAVIDYDMVIAMRARGFTVKQIREALSVSPEEMNYFMVRYIWNGRDVSRTAMDNVVRDAFRKVIGYDPIRDGARN